MTKSSNTKDAKRRKIYADNGVQWVKPSKKKLSVAEDCILMSEPDQSVVVEPGTYTRYIASFKEPYGVRKATGYYSNDLNRGILSERCFHEQTEGGGQHLHCDTDVFPTYSEAREDYVTGTEWRIKRMLDQIHGMVEANKPEA